MLLGRPLLIVVKVSSISVCQILPALNTSLVLARTGKTSLKSAEGPCRLLAGRRSAPLAQSHTHAPAGWEHQP